MEEPTINVTGTRLLRLGENKHILTFPPRAVPLATDLYKKVGFHQEYVEQVMF